MIIDFHTHIFPDKLAPRAIEALSATVGHMPPATDGSTAGLLRQMDAEGVDRAVVLNIATNGKQMHNVNDFAIMLNDSEGRLTGFGSVWPWEPAAAVEELHRLKEAGVKGVKFHPEYQDFYVDDDRMAPIYETVNQLGLITVFHAGLDIGYPPPAAGEPDARPSPERFARILPGFTAPLVLAHMGGYIQWLEVEKYLVGKNVYFDTSYCFTRIPMPQFARMAAAHGADRILFGSDTPWSSPKFERMMVEALEISEDEKAAILGGNAARLLDM